MEKIDYNVLKRLDEQFGSPFYIMDTNKYRLNLNSFLDAFRKRYKKVIAGYSFKTNYVPILCKIALKEGCFAEVVSEMEYELARKIGFTNIIFNGPIKRSHILKQALDEGAIVNLDSEYEVDFVCRYKQQHPNNEIQVGIRINVNITDENGKSVIQCGLRFGRFGFPNEILAENINRLRQADIKIVSLHGHTSTSDRAVINYKIIVQHMLSVCEKYELNDLSYFDVGGGFFGAAPEGMDLSGRPKYADYANCIIDEVERNLWFKKYQPYIVIEPGASVVSNVFSYYTKVYQNKKVGNVNFVMVDGTVFDVKPTMHSNNLPHDVYAKESSISESIICDVVGSTCMEKDVMLKDVELPKINAGDFIQFRGVGAYTICLTPTFINFLEPILLEENNHFFEARRRQNINDVLNVYKSPLELVGSI